MTIVLQQTAEAAQGGGSPWSMLIFMAILFGVMYFFMIRPQQKRQKELNKFRSELKNGQKIVTAGGIYGTIKEVKDTYVLLDVDSSTTIRVDRGMIMRTTDDVDK